MQANGFYGSRGISGRIPEGYTLLEQRFMRAVRKAGRLPSSELAGITLEEWEKEGWTYHAKGEVVILQILQIVLNKLYRSMVEADEGLRSISYTLRIDKSELAISKPGYRAILHSCNIVN